MLPPLECGSCHVSLAKPLTRKVRVTQLWPSGRDEFLCDECWASILAYAMAHLYERMEAE